MNVLRLVLAVNSVSKTLNRVEKIPICVTVNNATRGFHCSREYFCVNFYDVE